MMRKETIHELRTRTVTGRNLRTYSGETVAPDPSILDRSDIRYAYLKGRGINARFSSQPGKILVARHPRDIETALRGLATGMSVKVRGGGHCFDALVDVPDVDLLIDVSAMKGVTYEPEHRAFAVGAGATLGEVYRDLFLGWGLTIPAGRCPAVGIAGHIMGGGGGALSRQAGLSVDHVYGVEVVLMDPDGLPRRVLATREPDDPHHDLWWAHTGGGGGIGVVTKYLFSSPYGGSLLVQPPRQFIRFSTSWSWDELSQSDFTKLVSNYLDWLARNSHPSAADLCLDTALTLPRADGGPVTLEVSVSEPNTTPDVAEAFMSVVTRGVPPGQHVEPVTVPFIDAMLQPDEYDGIKGRFKAKSAFLRHSLTEQQIEHIYHALNDSTYKNPAAMLHISSHGGRVNAVAEDATAMPHRDVSAKLYWSCFWWDPREDSQHLTWLKRFYEGLFPDSNGRPAPQSGYGGAFINYPDLDLVEETSTVETDWSALYFRGNAHRLAEIKQAYDPLDLFGNRLTPGHGGA